MSSFTRWTERFVGLACSDCDPSLWGKDEQRQHEEAGDSYEKAYVFAIPADEKRPDYCPRCGSYLSLDIEEDSLTIHGHILDRYDDRGST
jgi:hypothetical protein